MKHQKGRPIPIHLQAQVAEELKRLIKNGYLEKTEDCFVIPEVMSKGRVKKNQSINFALDSKN